MNDDHMDIEDDLSPRKVDMRSKEGRAMKAAQAAAAPPRTNPRQTNPRQTMPRQTLPRDPVRTEGEVVGRNGEILTRRTEDGGDRFEIPARLKEKGWDYQWIAQDVVGNRDVVMDLNHQMHETGWRPVEAGNIGKHMMPPGHVGPIIRGRQMLCERPSVMGDWARTEEKRKAVQQMRDRDEALMGGKAKLNSLPGQGIPVMGTGDREGRAVRMQIDPALDVPMPSHTLAEPGE